MKHLIMIYLLTKSAWKRKFTWFDVALAKAVRDELVPPEARGDKFSTHVTYFLWVPDWLRMIAAMEQEAPLEEAWHDFLFDLAERAKWWLT
jgi:hypothetical protein